MKHQNKFTIFTMILAPSLLVGWFFTQAFQFLFLLGLFYVLTLIFATFALVVVAVIVPRFKDEIAKVELDTYVAETKLAVKNPLVYPVYVIMYSMLAALLYFGHYLLFTNLFAILIVSLITRSIVKASIRKFDNDSNTI